MPLFAPPDINQLSAKQNIKGLTRALGYKEPGIRLQAVIALGKISKADCVEPLIKALRYDNDKSVRILAAKSLGEIKGPEIGDRLIAAAKYDNELEVRLEALNSFLKEQRNPSNLDDLLELCIHEDRDIGSKSILALLSIRNQEAEQVFVEKIIGRKITHHNLKNGRSTLTVEDNLEAALDNSNGDLFLGKETPLTLLTIETITFKLAYAVSRNGDNLSKKILDLLHKCAIIGKCDIKQSNI